MSRDPILVDGVAVSERSKQAIEHGDVAAGPKREMQVRDLGRRRAARIDHHDFRSARLLGRDQPLEQDRVTPREV